MSIDMSWGIARHRRCVALVLLSMLATVWSADAMGTSCPLVVAHAALGLGVVTGGHTLGTASGEHTLYIPYFTVGSYVSVQNVGTSNATLSVQYRDLTGQTILVAAYSLDPNAYLRWAPLVNEPALATAEWSATIVSDQPLVGQLELLRDDGTAAVHRLTGSETADPTLIVPHFERNSFISVMNVGSTATILHIEYRDPAGSDQTPDPNTFPLAAGESVRWAPLLNDPDVEGPQGNAVPDMSGNASEGSAVITNTGQPEPLAGQVELRLGITPSPCDPGDINQDGRINAVDIQLVVNAALGIPINP